METYEIDVELRVRKTLILAGPTSADAAREIIAATLAGNGISLDTFLKYQPDGYMRPWPVETIIDNDPQIVAVREATQP